MKMRANNVIMGGIGGIVGAVAGWAAAYEKYQKEKKLKDDRINKFKKYFDVTNEWIRLKNEGRNLTEFFEKNKWSKIAIYGMGELGNRLAEELEGSSITIEYAIDKKESISHPEIKIKSMQDNLPPVDVIVVTPFFMYDAVEAELMELVEYPVISIEDVVLFI